MDDFTFEYPFKEEPGRQAFPDPLCEGGKRWFTFIIVHYYLVTVTVTLVPVGSRYAKEGHEKFKWEYEYKVEKKYRIKEGSIEVNGCVE